ncbi:MAG: hypothetical protein QOG49_539 [Frankiaceae bacterium]|nr:hypothetical protein [Frankiaceae bacterium]
MRGNWVKRRVSRGSGPRVNLQRSKRDTRQGAGAHPDEAIEMDAHAALQQQFSAWDEATDGAFFRIVAGLFSAEYLYGAGVLLAQNDADLTD